MPACGCSMGSFPIVLISISACLILAAAAEMARRKPRASSLLSWLGAPKPERLTELNRLLSATAAGASPESLIDDIARAACLCGADRCAWLGPDGEIVSGGEKAVTVESLWTCRAVRDALALGTPSTGTLPASDLGGPSSEHSAHVLAVPVVVEDSECGCLVFIGPSVSLLGKANRAFLASLTNVVAVAESRRRLATQVRRQAEGLEKVIDLLPGMLIGMDADSRIVVLNLACLESTGVAVDRFVGMYCSEFFATLGVEVDVGTLVRQAMASPTPLTIHTRLSLGGRDSAVIRWTVARLPDGFRPGVSVFALGQNVTDHVRMQEKLERSERLCATGQAVAGVAHELNNPLTAILGSAELLEACVTTDADRRHLGNLVSQTRRAQRIIANFLTFARGDEPPREPIQLADVVTQTLELIRHQLEVDNIQVVTQFEADAAEVNADPNELQQILINLLTNAQHSLMTQGGGEIWVRTGAAGSQATMSVTDNGPGIAEALLDRIFEPFITTKSQGMGTGLGLNICKGIVERYGGQITAENLPEGGASVAIALPGVTRAAQFGDRSSPRHADAQCAAEQRDGARVLIIDDQEPVRMVLQEWISAEGLRVDAAADGETGLSLARREEYDLILCDLNMPGMSGEEFYENLAAENPSLAAKVVFATGDAGNPRTECFLKRHSIKCLPKPFSGRHVLQLVQGSMAGKPPAR